KPVVAYASGGLYEILHAAGCGELLAPVGDIDQLAQRVNSMLAVPGLAAVVGSLARERVDAVYGPAAYRVRLQGLAERWNLRYCPALPEPAGAPELPAAAEA
ncbi:hypothetical protein, partial [Paenibacillus graminis]